jgi:hypothetical protein
MEIWSAETINYILKTNEENSRTPETEPEEIDNTQTTK